MSELLHSNVVSEVTQPPIPAEDLTRQYERIGSEIRAAVERALPRGRYVLGPELEAFEQAYAEFCGTRYAIGVSNGTDALHLALAACGIGPGDEVITVPNTYIATAFAITYVGALPVFVDVQPDTCNLNPALLEEASTERTRAIIPVHLYGQPCEMDAIRAIARRHDLYVIEDAARAHGSFYHSAPVGSLSDIACFSFYPTKTFGALGDAGAITTNSEALNKRVLQLRYMGQKVKHQHEILGYQKRMDELHAAILGVKLPYLRGDLLAPPFPRFTKINQSNERYERTRTVVLKNWGAYVSNHACSIGRERSRDSGIHRCSAALDRSGEAGDARDAAWPLAAET